MAAEIGETKKSEASRGQRVPLTINGSIFFTYPFAPSNFQFLSLPSPLHKQLPRNGRGKSERVCHNQRDNMHRLATKESRPAASPRQFGRTHLARAGGSIQARGDKKKAAMAPPLLAGKRICRSNESIMSRMVACRLEKREKRRRAKRTRGGVHDGRRVARDRVREERRWRGER